MHLYYWDRKKLENMLAGFTGGQFQMQTREGFLFRGEIKESFAPSDKVKRVLISFTWLTERRFFFDEFWTLRPKWSLQQIPPKSPYLDVGFSYYYNQPDEDRIKMRGELGEICHFYRQGDYTNLIRNGDEFLPYATRHHLRLWRAIVVLLHRK